MNNNNHINEEDDFTGLDARFSKDGKHSPFNAGDDYFESFATKIQHRVSEFEEFKLEAPLFSDIPKYNPFTVPADYFDELPNVVRELVTVKKSSAFSLKEWLQLVIRPRFVVPVLSVAIIAFAGISYVNHDVAPQPATAFAEESNVEEQLQNIDESTIIDAIASSESSPETTAPAENADNTNDHIVDYLMDDNVDESNLTSSL